MATTVAEIRKRLQEADEREFAVLERSLVADARKGVRAALETARRRLDAERAERERLAGLYELEERLMVERGAQVAAGLDEVGRGPVAGPLTVGAVVLPREPRIAGLNDSKQVSPAERERIAAEVKRVALAWTVRFVEPREIDERGMAACLRSAFSDAVADLEQAGVRPDLLLLDGNPLHFDEREESLVHGDARCASIAAASIVAKVERDALMVRLDARYPGYGFASNKGYGSAEHIDAIKRLGLCPAHRESFCTAFTQPTLF
ncbi:MAG TPA: ribonuclease HII [Candidatus Aphodovivens avistercoris]|nr:ribonuclease HII [Candidatus Aphodovivens avistercoris]